MASRAVGFAASRSAGAADSETIVASGSRKKTTTTVYTSDGSGGLKKEPHTHVESSGSQGSSAIRRNSLHFSPFI